MTHGTPPDENSAAAADYSAAATVIPFPHPLPLLRTPLPSSTNSTFLLAFPSPSSFSFSLLSARRSLVSQCETGARIACALSASARCQPPFWHRPSDFSQRARCEERESSACFHLAKDRCVEFAKDKCLRGFRDARVRVGGERKVEWREVGRAGLYLCGRDFGIKRLGSWAEVQQRCFVTTCCRGSDLLDSEDPFSETGYRGSGLFGSGSDGFRDRL